MLRLHSPRGLLSTFSIHRMAMAKVVLNPVNLRPFSTTLGLSLYKNSKPNISNSTTTTSNGTTVNSGDAIMKRIPKFLRPYTSQFINAPFSHVTAFLILHELSAIVPLIGIWWLLHKYQITLPMDLPSWAIEKGSKIIDDSLANFDFTSFTLHDKITLIMEGAYAYVIVKFLLPVRICFSLVLMPWFARWFILPVTNLFKPKRKLPPPAVTDATVNQVNIKKVDKPRL